MIKTKRSLLVCASLYIVIYIMISGGLSFFSILGAFLTAGIYLAPSLIFVYRHNPESEGFTILNTLIGWTGIGWVITLLLVLQAQRLELVEYEGENFKRKPAAKFLVIVVFLLLLLLAFGSILLAGYMFTFQGPESSWERSNLAGLIGVVSLFLWPLTFVAAMYFAFKFKLGA